MTLESILPVRPETPCAPLVVAFEVAIERTGLRVVEFRVDWGRDRERREIAELEQVAAMLLDLWERGWPASRPSFLDEPSALVKRQALEAVHEALGGAVAPRRVPGRPRKMTVRPGRHPRAMAKKAVKGKRIRRSPEDLAKLQPWVCPGCKNENEPQFDACWSCGAERPSS